MGRPFAPRVERVDHQVELDRPGDIRAHFAAGDRADREIKCS
jgi:hypothetical protein